MTLDEAQRASKALEREGVQTKWIKVLERSSEGYGTGEGFRKYVTSTDPQHEGVILAVAIAGPRGGTDVREYTSYQACIRAIPAMKRRNATRSRSRR